MKKVFKLTALLLLVGALLVGCKNNGEDKLPGNWTTTATYYSYSSALLKGTGPSYVYKDDYSGAIESGAREVDEYPTEANSFNFTAWTITEETNFTGFTATAKSSPADAVYGFAFFIDNSTKGKWSYYTLIIDDDAFMLEQKVAGSVSILKKWEKNDAIKAVTTENKVTVYSNKGSVYILINDTLVYTITNPVIKSGKCGIIGCVTYEEYTTATPVTTTYKFEEFQY
jgi:hypothetical protein